MTTDIQQARERTEKALAGTDSQWIALEAADIRLILDALDEAEKQTASQPLFAKDAQTGAIHRVWTPASPPSATPTLLPETLTRIRRDAEGAQRDMNYVNCYPDEILRLLDGYLAAPKDVMLPATPVPVSPTREPMRFSTVGELRRALDGVPDDRFVACQVIGQDGGAWNMWGSFCPQVPQGTIAALTFEHAELKTLPTIPVSPAEPSEDEPEYEFDPPPANWKSFPVLPSPFTKDDVEMLRGAASGIESRTGGNGVSTDLRDLASRIERQLDEPATEPTDRAKKYDELIYTVIAASRPSAAELDRAVNVCLRAGERSATVRNLMDNVLPEARGAMCSDYLARAADRGAIAAEEARKASPHRFSSSQ